MFRRDDFVEKPMRSNSPASIGSAVKNSFFAAATPSRLT
jgi:hypothetical protein